MASLHKKILRIQTNSFILPCFLELGSFVTGRCYTNNTNLTWCDKDNKAGEKEAQTFMEEKGFNLNGISCITIGQGLYSPFIPMVSNQHVADGLGNIFYKGEDSHLIKMRSNKSLDKKFERLRKMIVNLKVQREKKTIKTWGKIFKKRKKLLSQNTFPAYTDLGIIFSTNKIDPIDLESIKKRAMRFSVTGKITVTGFTEIDFHERFLKGLDNL